MPAPDAVPAQHAEHDVYRLHIDLTEVENVVTWLTDQGWDLVAVEQPDGAPGARTVTVRPSAAAPA